MAQDELRHILFCHRRELVASLYAPLLRLYSGSIKALSRLYVVPFLNSSRPPPPFHFRKSRSCSFESPNCLAASRSIAPRSVWLLLSPIGLPVRTNHNFSETEFLIVGLHAISVSCVAQDELRHIPIIFQTSQCQLVREQTLATARKKWDHPIHLEK